MFDNRRDAGRALGVHLADQLPAAENPTGDLVVVGLPRGGVPVAYEVATALAAPLDVIVVRKLGVPYRPELAMGAVGEGGTVVVDDRTVALTRVTQDELAAAEERERAEVDDRARRYRAGHSPVPLAGRTVVVVDDGIATGSTATAACRIVRARGATAVILAVPVGPPGSARNSVPGADRTYCLVEPEHFAAVGEAYRDFTQTSDDEVIDLLDRRPTGPAVSSRTRG